MSSVTRKLANLEKRVFSDTLAECHRREAFRSILAIISGQWQENCDRLREHLELAYNEIELLKRALGEKS